MNSDAQIQILSVFLGDQAFGIPIAEIQDISRPLPVVNVPLTEPSIEGLSNLRGRIMTIIDLRKRIGAENTMEQECMTVVIESQEELYGIRVDRVGDVITLDVPYGKDMPSPTYSMRYDFAQGIYQENDRNIIILDTEKLVRFHMEWEKPS